MLITLAIIGVVAALTIPTLVANYQEKGWNTSATVFERKLEESLKVMNTQGTLAGYKTTEDFVSELQKHLKITKVCKNDDLQSCFEETVMFGAGEADPEEVDMSTIKTAKHFGQKEWGTNIVGLQINNGTSALLAYNPDCKQDPYNNQIAGTSCVAVLYDTSGYAKPNTSGKDLRAINVAKLGRSCAFEINGTCYGAPFMPTPHVWNGCTFNGRKVFTTDPEDLKFMADYGIRECLYSSTSDYWAGAVKVCGGVNKMPTNAQLAEIANYIYNTDKVQGTNYVSGLIRDDEKLASLGITANIWSEEDVSSYAYSRYFDDTRTDGNVYYGPVTYSRSFSGNQAVCIVD